MLTLLITMSVTSKKWSHTSKIKTINTKRNKKNYKTLNTILESVDTIGIIGATSTSRTLSITGFGLIFLPVSAGIECTLSLANKVLQKIIMNKCTKNKKQYENDQQTIKSLDKMYGNSLQDTLIEKKTNMKVYVKILPSMLMKLKMNLFKKYEQEKK